MAGRRWMLSLGAFVGGLALVLPGCNTPGLPVKLVGAVNFVQATGVTCSPSGSAVDVTGNLTAVGSPASENIPDITAQIYDSGGNTIGNHADQPQLTINSGDTASFNFSVPITGTPSSCVVQWDVLNPETYPGSLVPGPP